MAPISTLLKLISIGAEPLSRPLKVLRRIAFLTVIHQSTEVKKEQP
jgi:hypothetical protein